MGDSVTNLTEVCLHCLLIPIFDQFLLFIVPFPFDASNKPLKTFYLIDENRYVLCNKPSLKSVFSLAFSVSCNDNGNFYYLKFTNNSVAHYFLCLEFSTFNSLFIVF